MKVVRNIFVTLLVIAVLGGILEYGLRAFMPSMIESGSRIALRVPANQPVEVETPGLMALNALRWSIADVTVEAEGVPLGEGITAEATLEVGRMPLFPAVGKLHDGTAAFTIPAEQLQPAVQTLTGGAVNSANMIGGQLYVSGIVTPAQFNLPTDQALEVRFRAAADLKAEDGDIVVALTEIKTNAGAYLGPDMERALADPQRLCVKDLLPRGVVIDDIDVSDEGQITLNAKLSERLLSSVEERAAGTCS